MRYGILNESYGKDDALFQTKWIKIWIVLLYLGLLMLPFIASDTVIFNCNRVLIAIVGAVGLNMLTGVCGQISLGHAAFIGVGAYTTAVLMTKLGFSYWLALPAAGIISTVVGLIVGIPSLRVKGFYLCIATLAAQIILMHVFVRWEWMTGGPKGINIPAATMFQFSLDTERKFYFVSLAFAIGAVLYGRNLLRSKMGRAFVAIRDRDLAAELMGVSLFKYKLMAFAVSSFYAGVTGALLAGLFRTVHPTQYSLMESIQYLAIVLVGGMGSILGTIFGTIFILMLPEVLNILAIWLKELSPGLSYIATPMKQIIFGIAIIFFMVFEPMGLAELWRRTKNFFLLWPFGR